MREDVAIECDGRRERGRRRRPDPEERRGAGPSDGPPRRSIRGVFDALTVSSPHHGPSPRSPSHGPPPPTRAPTAAFDQRPPAGPLVAAAESRPRRRPHGGLTGWAGLSVADCGDHERRRAVAGGPSPAPPTAAAPSPLASGTAAGRRPAARPHRRGRRRPADAPAASPAVAVQNATPGPARRRAPAARHPGRLGDGHLPRRHDMDRHERRAPTSPATSRSPPTPPSPSAASARRTRRR